MQAPFKQMSLKLVEQKQKNIQPAQHAKAVNKTPTEKSTAAGKVKKSIRVGAHARTPPNSKPIYSAIEASAVESSDSGAETEVPELGDVFTPNRHRPTEESL